MTYRITVETVAAGQPRPYADSRYIYHILVEHKPYKSIQGPSGVTFEAAKEFEPWDMTVEAFRDSWAPKVHRWNDDPKDWAAPKLGSCRKLPLNEGDPKGPCKPGWYELVITMAFTD